MGLVKEFQSQGELDGEVARAFENNLETLGKLGAEVVEVSLPSLEYAITVYYILAPPARPAPTWDVTTACVSARGRNPAATCRRCSAGRGRRASARK